MSHSPKYTNVSGDRCPLCHFCCFRLLEMSRSFTAKLIPQNKLRLEPFWRVDLKIAIGATKGYADVTRALPVMVGPSKMVGPSNMYKILYPPPKDTFNGHETHLEQCSNDPVAQWLRHRPFTHTVARSPLEVLLFCFF